MVPLTSRGANGTAEVPEHVDLVGGSVSCLHAVGALGCHVPLHAVDEVFGSVLWSLSDQGQW